MMGADIPMGRRISGATRLLVANVIVWILIPAVISSEIGASISSLPLANPEFIYTFGSIVVGLQVLGALTEGSAASEVFTSGSYVASAYYIWTAGGGGTFSFSTMTAAQPLSLSVDFKTLLFLLVLPSLVGAIRIPLVFLLDRSEAGQPARDLP